MQTYLLTEPPHGPGLYTLTNRKTGQIYIGRTRSLVRRYREWRAIFQNKLGATNATIDEIIRTSSIEDWEFGVLLEIPLERVDELAALEERAIRRISDARPDKVINCAVPTRSTALLPTNASTALTTVTGHDGTEMTYSEVASALGVTHQAVKKRLANWRRKGRTVVKLAELQKVPILET